MYNNRWYIIHCIIKTNVKLWQLICLKFLPYEHSRRIWMHTTKTATNRRSVPGRFECFIYFENKRHFILVSSSLALSEITWEPCLNFFKRWNHKCKRRSREKYGKRQIEPPGNFRLTLSTSIKCLLISHVTNSRKLVNSLNVKKHALLLLKSIPEKYTCQNYQNRRLLSQGWPHVVR